MFGSKVLATALCCGMAAFFTPFALAKSADSKSSNSKASDAPVDFGRDVRPVLAKKCFPCHGPDKAEAGLRLDLEKSALAKLESGVHAVTAGKPDESELLRRVRSTDENERMPPEGKPLTAGEIDAVRRWIAQGAEWKEPWAYSPVRRPPVPTPADAPWVRNPIDALILSKLEAQRLTPAPAAEKTALLRRVTYDLIGLPPSPEEIQVFLADDSADAYEKVVDRLLASPHFGERWARHWLDVVRFAETNSFERDGVKPNAWRYRDYVIRSFNDDKPYDQFVREQLAGDEIPNPSHDQLIATGFYRLGLWDDEPADRLQARYDELDDVVTTTSQAFLGLTVNCARCHDHKIDPIPQADYYKLLSFFHEIQSYGARSQTDISSPETAQRWADHEAAVKDLEGRLKPIEQEGIVKMSAEDQRKTEGRQREEVLKKQLKNFLSPERWTEYTELKTRYDELKSKTLPPRESAMTVASLGRPPETFIHARGNPHVKGDKVEPGFLQVLGGGVPKEIVEPKHKQSSGRRTALADWITSKDNPLTARVMVNRMWQHHFGRGIVRSSNNFGLLGEPPTHPELLDWLSAEFVEQGWRMKPLHRLIVTSNAYRMSSRANPEALARDPMNDLFWRFDMRRLSAEEIRDSLFAVTGRLNPKMFGPGIYPTISREVLAGQSQPGKGWGNSSAEEQARRSVYIHVKRSLITPLLSAFDFPETDGSCEARFVTTQPAQALAMMNGDFLHEQAQALAARLTREAGDQPEDQLRLGLRLVLCRPNVDAEAARLTKLWNALQSKHGLSKEQSLQYVCLVALNLNEFIYLD